MIVDSLVGGGFFYPHLDFSVDLKAEVGSRLSSEFCYRLVEGGSADP